MRTASCSHLCSQVGRALRHPSLHRKYQRGYHSRSRDICSTPPPTVSHFCVSIMCAQPLRCVPLQRAVSSSNVLNDVELGSASLLMRCAALDAQMFSLDAQRKLAAAAQRAEGQPQRLRSDLKQKRHSPLSPNGDPMGPHGSPYVPCVPWDPHGVVTGPQCFPVGSPRPHGFPWVPQGGRNERLVFGSTKRTPSRLLLAVHQLLAVHPLAVALSGCCSHGMI